MASIYSMNFVANPSLTSSDQKSAMQRSGTPSKLLFSALLPKKLPRILGFAVQQRSADKGGWLLGCCGLFFFFFFALVLSNQKLWGSGGCGQPWRCGAEALKPRARTIETYRMYHTTCHSNCYLLLYTAMIWAWLECWSLQDLMKV